MSVITVGMSQHTLQYYSPSHTHAVWEIVLNIKGYGSIVVDGKSYDFAPGVIICIPPDSPHEKKSADGFRDIYIQASSLYLPKHLQGTEPVIVSDDTEGSFESLMFLSLRNFHKRVANYINTADALMEAINQLILGRVETAPGDQKVEALLNTIVASFTDSEFNITAALEKKGFCRDHMRRRFKQVTGQTPIEYLTMLRIEHAKSLMRKNDVLRYTISEIGELSGYYDNQYFSRVFKRRTGMTPTEFLRINK